MTQGFDSEALARLAWRQGSILGAGLAQLACEYDPRRVAMNDEDRLIVTSHDCDVVSPSLDKEPVVEILRGQIATARRVDTQLSGGRNPRMLHLAFEAGATGAVLVCSVHDRWPIPTTTPRARIASTYPAATKTRSFMPDGAGLAVVPLASATQTTPSVGKGRLISTCTSSSSKPPMRC